MSFDFLSSRFGTRLRTAARKAGLITLLRPFLHSQNYEEAFSTRLLKEIRPEDRVWDVGANVGYYTKQFATAVGRGGEVVAFEPSPQTYTQLVRATEGLPCVKTLKVALGFSNQTIGFVTDSDPHGVTHRLASPGECATEMVEVTTGDSVVGERSEDIPNVIKIDVEGFEDDVLKGMPRILRSPALRAVFVEVHFAQLARRGRPDGPGEVIKLLTSAGLRTSWLDPSHVCAIRRP